MICIDIRQSDSMLASMDIQGIILIRNISNLNDADTVLHKITSVPKEVDTFAKVLFNCEKPGAEAELIVIVTDTVIFMDVEGRHTDTHQHNSKFISLQMDNSALLDNNLIYKLLALNLSCFE